MDLDVIAEHLKRPPEEVRLRVLYPELPDPIPFADALAPREWNEYDQDPPELRGCWFISFSIPPAITCTGYAVTAEHARIVQEYQDAAERQWDAEEARAAARWERRDGDDEPREPEPEAIPPKGDLTPRQEEFCRHYATQPVATRAAVLAGYSEENAAPYGSRLLKNPLVLERIAALRAEKNLEYVVERDTLHDKLEAVFFEALDDRNQAAAVAALRLQALLAGMTGRATPAAKPDGGAESKAKKSQGRRAKSQEKPRWTRAESQEKPRRHPAKSQGKPIKANRSQ